MATPELIGFSEPPTFSRPLQGGLLDSVERSARTLFSRRDQAAKAASVLAGMALCPEGRPFTAKEVARCTPQDRQSSYRQVGRFLDGGGWNLDGMRRWLIRWGAQSQIEAIVVETYELVGPGSIITDIVSIHVMGEGYSIPVGWRRLVVECRGEDHPVDFEAHERMALLGLLTQLRGDCEAGEVSLEGVPIISRESRQGENERLRDEVGALGFEHFFEVNPLYQAPLASKHPYGDQSGGTSLVESMPISAEGVFPEPRSIGPAGAPNSELVVPYTRSGRPGYGIARPRPGHPARLGGYRSRARGLEMAGIASRVSLPDAARRLRLDHFRHQSDGGWVAGATLVSFWQAHSIGPQPMPSA